MIIIKQIKITEPLIITNTSNNNRYHIWRKQKNKHDDNNHESNYEIYNAYNTCDDIKCMNIENINYVEIYDFIMNIADKIIYDYSKWHVFCLWKKILFFFLRNVMLVCNHCKNPKLFNKK